MGLYTCTSQSSSAEAAAYLERDRPCTLPCQREVVDGPIHLHPPEQLRMTSVGTKGGRPCKLPCQREVVDGLVHLHRLEQLGGAREVDMDSSGCADVSLCMKVGGMTRHKAQAPSPNAWAGTRCGSTLPHRYAPCTSSAEAWGLMEACGHQAQQPLPLQSPASATGCPQLHMWRKNAYMADHHDQTSKEVDTAPHSGACCC